MGHIHDRQLVDQLGWSSGALKEGARPGQARAHKAQIGVPVALRAELRSWQV